MRGVRRALRDGAETLHDVLVAARAGVARNTQLRMWCSKELDPTTPLFP